MRSAKEILDQIPFLKSYRGYEDMLLCMELVAENEERLVRVRERVYLPVAEYYGAAEPPVRCGESHLSGLTEPPHFVY